jgi:carnitine-CoA ligase
VKEEAAMTRLYDATNYDDRLIHKVVEWQAANNPERLFLQQDDRYVTFAETGVMARRYADGLRAFGIEKGDVVAMVMSPSPDVVLAGLGVVRLGGIFMTLNTEFRKDFLAEAIAMSRARILIIDAAYADRLLELETLGEVEHVFVKGDIPQGLDARPLESLTDNDGSGPAGDIQPGDNAFVWWSSGTTGKQKGVMHTHASLMFRGYRGGLKLADDEVSYACTPMYLGSPWNVSIWMSLVGGTTVAIDPAFSVSKFWDRIRFYGATRTILLGAMHVHLLQAAPRPDDRDHTLREAFFTPCPYEKMPEYKERFGIAKLPQAFGTSEAMTIFEAPDDGTPWSGRAVGRPVPHYEVKLLDDRGIEVPVGQVGEICLRPKLPDIMFNGYFGNAEATWAISRNFWHHVGDFARRDEDGIYYFEGRKKDYIRYKGRNLALAEVEMAVSRHPKVDLVAAFGVQSAEIQSEDELALAIVLKEGVECSGAEIADYLTDHAPYYFVPRYIDFLNALPLNGHGRVVKDELSKSRPADRWDGRDHGYSGKRSQKQLEEAGRWVRGAGSGSADVFG